MTVWSYSALQSFETCPRRYQLTKVIKIIKEPQTEATLHGNAVHKALENYGKLGTPIPEKMVQYKPLVDAVIQSPGNKFYETKFALTEKLTPTTFFASDCWVRGVLDLQVVRTKTAIVLDWKTGKPKSDGDQLKLFAGATFALHPFVETVRTGYAWLAYNKLDQETYSRGQQDEIWSEFRVRVSRLDDALKYDEFPPRPSGLCREWCPVTKKHCEFSGRN